MNVLWNFLVKFIHFLSVTNVDNWGTWLEVFKHFFYQCALKSYKSDSVLLNRTHQQWCKLHTEQSVYQCFVDLKAPVCEHRMHWISFKLYTHHYHKRTYNFYYVIEWCTSHFRIIMLLNIENFSLKIMVCIQTLKGISVCMFMVHR